MKFRRTVSSVVASVFLVVAVLLLVVQLRLATFGMDKVRSLIQGFLQSSSNSVIEVKADGMESTLMRSLKVNGISVSVMGSEVAQVNSVEVSLTLWDVLKLALGKNNRKLDVIVNDVTVRVDDDSVQFIMNAMKTLSGSDPDGSSETAQTGKGKDSGTFSDLGVSLSVRNLCLYGSYKGTDAVSEGINASADLDAGLVLQSAELNAPAIVVSGSALGGSKAVVKDIRVSVDSDLVTYVSVLSGAYSDIAGFSELSAIAKIEGGIVSAAVYVDKGTSSVPVNGKTLDISVDGTTVSANYAMSDSSTAFSVLIDEINASQSGSELSASLKKADIIGSFDGKEALSFNLGMEAIDGKIAGAGISASDINTEVGMVLGNLSSIGQLNLASVRLYSEAAGLKDVLSQGNVIDYSYSRQGLSVRFRSSLSGEHDSSLIGRFGANLDISAQIKDMTSVSSASVAIRDIVAASLPDASSFEIELADSGNIHAGLKVGSCLETSADYYVDSGDVALNVYITDLMPASFKALYDNYLSSVATVGADTVINGNMVINASSTESFSSYVKAFHEGEYAPFGFESPLDILSAGRISVNTAVNNLHVGSSSRGGAFTLEATVEDTIANIESLAVSTGGVRISYFGTIDLLQTVPEGMLVLQKTSDGSMLASLSFMYEQGARKHSFIFDSPFAKDLSISGDVNWNDLSSILIDGVLVAPFFPDDLSFCAVFSPSPLSFSLQGDSLDFELSAGDGLLALAGNLDDLEISPKEDMVIRASSLLNAVYHTDGTGFGVDLKGFSVLVSDSFEVGFDLSVTDHSIYMTNLKLGILDDDEFYNGALDFSFSDIPSLMNLDTSSLDGTVEFVRTNSRTTLRGVATDNQFSLQFDFIGSRNDSLNASLSILGQRNNAIYASAVLNWGRAQANSFSLNAIYDDRKLSIYDSGGKLGSLLFEDLNLVLDFSRLRLDGSMNFRNEKVFKNGETKTQSGRIGITASGQSVSSDSLFQILTGQEYSVDFKMSLTDFRLSDGYSIADTQVDMHLENGLLSFSGSLLNGSFDTASGYLELDIDEKNLFGFKARGYVGQELDLLLTDLRFPLPLMNQFMNVPNFSFTDGLIEGDVLVKGPVSNPSLYGMAYCQSYEMTLFYLPDQTITVKNVALSINDHSILVSRTPIAGYSEADGRYFFGDVSVDIILQGLGVETFDVNIFINPQTPVDFWLPILLGENELEVRGDVYGYVDFAVHSGKPKLTTDITVSSMLIDFRFDEEVPDWLFAEKKGPPDMDITLTTGHDVEFYYPERVSPFINFTLAENRTARFIYEDGSIKTGGSIALKTGQVYYFRNDFIIKEGSVDLSERNIPGSEGSIPVLLNLRAEITDYDSDGNKVIISMMLQNATLDNITPRFSSTPAMSENEILAMLGQSVLASGALDRSLSLSSLARFAATARDALTRVGLLESNKNYSITGIVRTSLGLDIFSARSNILSNVIIDALPGELTGRADVSILARYLDRTSLFAGKYIGDNWFVKVRLMLKADSNVKLSKKVGHFLAKDLILDTEISLDWDTPMGTLSVFTQPQELSVFEILDTIGFSVTKQIQY